MNSKDLNGKTIQDSTPVPDPTTLTTDQLRREIASLRELLEGRLTGMDTATELVKAANDKVPCLVDQRVRQIEKIMEEKFMSIYRQFLDRDAKEAKVAELGQTALTAALAAAKEAVGKTEIAFTKQIDATVGQIQTTKSASDGQFEDVKGRLGTLEASINTRSVVNTEQKTQQGWMLPMIVSMVIGGLCFLSSIVIIIISLMGK